MDKRQWEVITRTELTAFTVGVVLFIALLIRSTQGFVPVLDYANLLFHEAGHPLISYISPRLEPYGGTIAQLLLPCLSICNFWSSRKVLGTAVGGIWLCENFLNIARYMADARTMVLPLVGGGHHDWSTIFRRWDVLQYDTEIAFGVTIAAWTGIAVCSMWVFWRARQSRFFVRASVA
jgi:hypothetical protein